MIKNIFILILGLLFIVGCENVDIPAEVQAPIANNDSAEVILGQSITISILNNDTDSDGTLDQSSVEIIEQPTHGTTTISDTGIVTFVANSDYLGRDSFTYKVKDNNGALSNEATVTINIVALKVAVAPTASTNKSPLANNDSFVATQNITILIDILKNDIDVDGSINSNSVSLITQVSHGTMVIGENGLISYKSDINYIGVDTFSYRVKDNEGGISNIATVYINVNSAQSVINIANNDAVEVAKGGSIVINVLDNDSNSSGTLDKSTIVIVKQATNGNAFSSTVNGTITYVANSNFVGTDSFTYKVKNDKGILSNEATVTVTVKESQNKAPVATNDSVKLDGVNTLEINVLDNDIDSDGSLIPSSIEIVSNVTHGSLSVNSSTGIITYTSDNSYTGIEIFTYRIKDNNGAYSNIATVEIDVVSLRLLKSDGIEEKAKEWYVRIVVEDTTNDMKTAGTQLGQLDTADVVTKHSLKAIAPFNSSSFLDVVFKDPVGVDAGEYKSNFHESSTHTDSWEFTVKSHDNNATMILSWRGLYVLTPYTDTEGREQYNEYRSLKNPLLPYMTIIDTANNEELKVIENSEVQTYVFRMDGATERTFRWELKDSSIPLASPLLATVPTEYKAKLKKLEVKVLRKDAKAIPDTHKKKRVDSIDMLTPPTFKVLVK